MANPKEGPRGWSAEQRGNAATIISVGLQMGMSWRDIQIGLMTAMTESGLRNLNYGDRDSAGLFQQRPSMGWGSFDQVTNPRYAAHKFFSVLKGVKGRDRMGLGQAAQAVQRSAFPDRYDNYAGAALAFVNGAKKGGPKITPSSTPVVDSTSALTPQQANAALDHAINAADAVTSWDPNDPSTWGGSAVADQVSQPVMPTGSAQDALAATTASGTGAPGLAAPMAGIPQGSSGGVDMSQFTDLQPFANPAEYTAVTGGGRLGQKGVDNTSNAVVAYAKQFIGTPYVWGGNDLSKGVDCSGFVQQVYKHFGVNLPRISYQQINSGTRVPLKALRPGDLIGWDNSPRNPGADHVALYAGNGMILEAPRPGIGVRLRKLGSDEGAWGVRLKH